MQVTEFLTRDFRNLKEIKISPIEKTNIICGENGQGKTNILENIWLFTGAKSFRGAKDSSFVNFNKENAQSEIKFISGQVLNEAKIVFNEKRNIYLNGKKIKSSGEISSCFKAIVFSPDYLSLIKRGPNERRKFFDLAIGQLYPSYIDILKNYIKAVTQRNEAIKNFKYDKTVEIMLDVFENEIAVYGEKIIKYRKHFLDEINKYLCDIYSDLSSKRENISAVYESNCKEDLKNLLLKSRKEDSLQGFTSVGPHRDDIDFKINGMSAKSFGSQGQQRSIVLSLILSKGEVYKNIGGEYPICLLDDVLSELDKKRQEYIINSIEKMQVFLTCCDVNDIKSVKNFENAKVFNCKDGEIF